MLNETETSHAHVETHPELETSTDEVGLSVCPMVRNAQWSVKTVGSNVK